MENAEKLIKKYNMLSKGETIAVAVSGGVDSICLLHYLNSIKNKYGINLVAVNIDHQIRKESASDSKFVAGFCKAIGIHCYKFKVNAVDFSKKK